MCPPLAHRQWDEEFCLEFLLLMLIYLLCNSDQTQQQLGFLPLLSSIEELWQSFLYRSDRKATQSKHLSCFKHSPTSSPDFKTEIIYLTTPTLAFLPSKTLYVCVKHFIYHVNLQK